MTRSPPSVDWQIPIGTSGAVLNAVETAPDGDSRKILTGTDGRPSLTGTDGQ